MKKQQLMQRIKCFFILIIRMIWEKLRLLKLLKLSMNFY